MKKIYCDIKKCLGCGSCEIACAVEHSKSKDLFGAIKETPLPIKRRKAQFIHSRSQNRGLQAADRQWPLSIPPKEPRALARVGSIARAVAISTGCHHCENAACVTACMSGAMYKDPKTGQTKHDESKCVGCWMCIMRCPFGALARQKEDKIVVKCDLCPDREVPACVEACHSGALFIGTLEEFKEKICAT